MNPYQSYMQKRALNALTRNIHWPKPGPSGFLHSMELFGKEIGHMQVDRHAIPGGATIPSVGWAEVDEKLQGMSLGRKLYGRVQRREFDQGSRAFAGDWNGTQSESARRLWEGQRERFGQAVREVPAPGRPGTDNTTFLMDLERRFKAKQAPRVPRMGVV